MATEKEKLADEIDLELDRQARKAHRAYERDGDQRWKNAYMKIDAARGSVRLLIPEAKLRERGLGALWKY